MTVNANARGTTNFPRSFSAVYSVQRTIISDTSGPSKNNEIGVASYSNSAVSVGSNYWPSRFVVVGFSQHVITPQVSRFSGVLLETTHGQHFRDHSVLFVPQHQRLGTHQFQVTLTTLKVGQIRDLQKLLFDLELFLGRGLQLVLAKTKNNVIYVSGSETVAKNLYSRS